MEDDSDNDLEDQGSKIRPSKASTRFTAIDYNYV